ncbi:MAG: helix-turn-helix domain-containing protein [Cetobacterium sp.]
MLSLDEKISKNIKNIMRNKFGTGTKCAEVLGVSPRSLNDSINKIKQNKYPSIKQLKRIASVCDCEITDFFKVD